MTTSSVWPDLGTLATVASVIAAFAITMIFFRVQRELQMHEQLEINWIPWADLMLLLAAVVALLLVLLPLVAAHPSSWLHQRLPGPACAAAILLVAGYPFALFAHYRLILGRGRRGPRVNPEPGERFVVLASLAAAGATALWAFHVHGP